MEDIGDIIYFVLIVIVAIGSFFKKIKKGEDKKKSSPAPNVDTSGGRDPWSEFEQMFEDERRRMASKSEQHSEPENTKRPEVRKTSFRKSPPAMDDLRSYETVSDSKDLRVKKNMQESITRGQTTLKTEPMADDDSQQEARYEFPLADVDDMRRAFVYSEIFNRKYH